MKLTLHSLTNCIKLRQWQACVACWQYKAKMLKQRFDDGNVFMQASLCASLMVWKDHSYLRQRSAHPGLCDLRVSKPSTSTAPMSTFGSTVTGKGDFGNSLPAKLTLTR